MLIIIIKIIWQNVKGSFLVKQNGTEAKSWILVSVKRLASGSHNQKGLKNSLDKMTALVLDVAPSAEIDANISLSINLALCFP